MSSASSTSAQLPTSMYSSDFVETNMDVVNDGGEMYAEVDKMQRMKVDSQVKLPEPYLTVINSK